MSPKYPEQIAIHTLEKREGGFTHLPPEPSPDATKSSLISPKKSGGGPPYPRCFRYRYAAAEESLHSRDSFSQVCKSLDTLFGYLG